MNRSNRIDLSKLPAPKLIEELDYEVILAEMRAKMRELCPEWTGYELESDPANKVLEVAAYREMLIRQRVNEAACGVMVAFATGSDLDHLAAFYPEKRLSGARAVFRANLKLSAPLDVDVTIPANYVIVAKNGEFEAKLRKSITLAPGETERAGDFEVTKPFGSEGNGLLLRWDAITPLPFVVAEIGQTEASHSGADEESDAAFRARIPESLHQWSTAGAYGAYRCHAMSADARIKDVEAWSPERGHVTVAVLAWEGSGVADGEMIERVRAKLNHEDARPGTDLVTVVSAEIVPYSIKMTLELYPGVAGEPLLEEATRRVREKVSALHGLGLDIPRSAITAAAHLEGIKRVDLVEPAEDIHIGRQQAAHCTDIEIGSRVADEI